ncbi:MAG: EAL domain-containing protein [Gammaproteobacteria bacterium]|nr:EAL domain-containing protein [Gammaproteobacteria bacterium]
MTNDNHTDKRENVLIIDDESVTRMMVRQVLEQSGYHVSEAPNGGAGLDHVKQQMPDLILLDVRMPDMNGFDTCRAIRTLVNGSHVPILMLTALDDIVSVQLAFDSGATDFITKPINWALLAQRLNYALRTKKQEEQLRASEARLAHAQQLARLGHWYFDPANDTVSMSVSLARDLGFDSERVSLQTLSARIHRQDRRLVFRTLRKVFTEGNSADIEFRLVNELGRVCNLHLLVERRNIHGVVVMEGTVQDVTARIEAEARISYFAHYDRLTDLPNRVLFWDRLTHSIAEGKRSGEHFAVLMIDLDRFNVLNASIGHTNGDLVIKEIASRLQGCLRSSDTLSRIGGDEFAIIYHGLDSDTNLGPTLSRLMSAFEEPVRHPGADLHVSASIGVAIFPDDGEDLDTLLMHVDVARSRAKQIPGTSYQFYASAMGASVRDRIAMEAALRDALSSNAFELYYQPLVRLNDSVVWGVEALLRWHHPERGMVPPDEFIPILEETGLLHDVGEWIVRQACNDMGDHTFVVSINLSPMQFRNGDLLDRILRVLDETHFPPERLQVEITENVLIDDHRKAKTVLEALRQKQVKVAVDDFGTGFSSLAYLKAYNADFLKIDKSFICELEEDKSNMAIVRSAINLGHDLGMHIIGEGVENIGSLDMLARMGCDVAQGYLIARPLDRGKLERWLAERDM